VIRSTRVLGSTIAAVLVVAGLGLAQVDPAVPKRVAPAGSAAFRSPALVTVAALLAERGMLPRPGRLLAVRSHRVLDATAFPALVRSGGALLSLADEVPESASLQVQPRPDQVERVVRRRVRVPADTGGGLYRPGLPTVVELRVGAVSGEVVGRRLVKLGRHGALRVPGTVLLTFDDGPDPTWTPYVLAVLKQRHVHAVFCVVGRAARKHPELLRRIVREGHVLCDHTEGHDEQLPREPANVMRAQIELGARAISAATGERPLWFRSPGGAWSVTVERVVAEAGMATLKWNVDPRDWERPPAHVIVGRVLRDARPGSIVLLHDGGGDRRATALALRSLLVALPRLGLRFAEPTAP
jgi:peptidoglycan/xylan/chitin deacetylase (PgdA/CDA1 family)